MAFVKKTPADFTFKHTGQADQLGVSFGGDVENIQEAFDSRAIDNQNQINALIDALKSVAVNDSGALQIGLTPILGLSATDVQNFLYELKVNYIDNMVDLGNDQIISGTKEFQDYILVPTPTTDYDAATKRYVDETVAGVVVGQIPDGSIGYVKLDSSTKNAVVPYGVCTNSGNNYSVTLQTALNLTDGASFSFKCNADSTGAVNINPSATGLKPIVKSSGTAVTNLKANGIYTVRYNVTTGNFILQGEGASGNATSSDLLSGKTATTDAGEIAGNIPVRTGTTSQVYYSSGPTQLIIRPLVGYYNGTSALTSILDNDFVANNIRENVSIFGIDGTLIEGKRWAEGTLGVALTYTQTANILLSTIGFTPKAVLVSYMSSDVGSSGERGQYMRFTGEGTAGASYDKIVLNWVDYLIINNSIANWTTQGYVQVRNNKSGVTISNIKWFAIGEDFVI